jgi:aryl-alcohol dehydrogenase-like predicted oxidoreductase
MNALIRAAVAGGVTFFDTRKYMAHRVNEELVGEALAPFRGHIVIAAQFGFAPAHEREMELNEERPPGDRRRRIEARGDGDPLQHQWLVDHSRTDQPCPT